MNTEKAIKLLREMQEAWKLQITGDAFDALEMAITALENNSNEQLNNSTATQFNAIKTHVKGLTACRVPEDDCISRTDAINTSLEFFVEFLGGALHENAQKELITRFQRLPSAQPEPERTMEEFMYGQDMGNPEDGSL